MRAELAESFVKIEQTPAMGFSEDSQDASHSETESDGNRTATFFIEQQQAVRAMLPCERDGSRFPGIEHGSLRHRLAHFFHDEE